MTQLHKKLRKKVVKALYDYRMIEKGDRVLVGISGGADSLSLLNLLSDAFIQSINPFSLIAVHIDLGFQEKRPKKASLLESYFRQLGVEYRIVHTEIYKRAFDPDAVKNPCFICSMYRRRKIYETAHREGCNKIAYGHHRDDIIETLLINIFYGRKIEAMNPVQEVFKGKMQIIRPLVYIEETLLKQFAGELELPVLPKLCPEDGSSRRQKIKGIIDHLQSEERYANIRKNIFRSLYHSNGFIKSIQYKK
ncbi:tRNA 2-thiocytidine(32) synthetase TtcA [bacterium]|nr:tRNA 2-thiocytidine(32) synthetase TtcA [bacterium]RQV93776.1 MAG: tRNA 2-thiocytidine(32) synthetase TtcA [bacterium]